MKSLVGRRSRPSKTSWVQCGKPVSNPLELCKELHKERCLVIGKIFPLLRKVAGLLLQNVFLLHCTIFLDTTYVVSTIFDIC